MEYLLFIATDTEPDTSPDDDPDIHAWVAEGERRGIRLRGDALRPLEDATTIRVRDGSFFEPVAGETFDLIATNPPFVISPATGERLVRRTCTLAVRMATAASRVPITALCAAAVRATVRVCRASSTCAS